MLLRRATLCYYEVLSWLPYLINVKWTKMVKEFLRLGKILAMCQSVGTNVIVRETSKRFAKGSAKKIQG